MRTTVLNMTDAIELIKPFLNSENEFEQYNSIYALAYFDDNTEVDTIYQIFKKNKFSNKVGRIAVSFLLKFGNRTHLDSIMEHISDIKPKEVSFTDNVTESIASYLYNNKKIDANIIYYAYLTRIIH